MKRLLSLALITSFILATLPGLAMAWDLEGFENANKERGQWAWFTGQARTCDEEIPVPGAHTRAEWREMFTTAKDKLPCGGAGINPRVVQHIFLFLYEHAADSDDPMTQKPESCG
ncbi:hypothetical protein [Desulfurivibrio alkaliphilus]|uniref:Cytochrome C n=1 Tax=Desulfurivibrio alkaliphilus (strain DSM 19089 / UNIQEM U267 / AHT2) TaxID=589865 RepID=D6YZX1_DESAT|nr:hypothetical protein [Desulfurivibrio alkaliphilus]ADH85128.1 hypothetical protein DaAHT2_0422 [Desulfurivibrio alkaliphilus AHT 2]